MRGADILVRSLRNAGVDRFFTLSGNQIMPVFDACIDARVALVHVRHEAAAVYMAEASAQLTGRPAVALLTAGPGFANGLAALYTAKMSESPVLVLAGDAPAARTGMGAFQELAQDGIAASLCKGAWKATSADGIARDVVRAVRLATSGRPGPVMLGLPVDYLLGEAREADAASAEAFAIEHRPPVPSDIAMVVDLLREAARPLIVTGPQLSDSRAPELKESLRARLGVPVLTLESPRGLRDPSLGAFAAVMARADLIVALGKDLDFRLGFGRPPVLDERARIAHVDPDKEARDRARIAVGDNLVASVAAQTHAFAHALAERGEPLQSEGTDWRRQVDAAVNYRPSAWAEVCAREAGRLHMLDVVRALQPVLAREPDSVLIIDGGECGQWAQAGLTAARRIINGPAGTIGASLPYALAARTVEHEAPVIAIMGDGTAGFHLSEFETAAREGLPVIVIVCNDARWNAEQVIQLREFGQDRAIGCDLLPARYDQAAAALGCRGEHVRSAEELRGALERALRAGTATCIDVPIESHAAPSFER